MPKPDPRLSNGSSGRGSVACIGMTAADRNSPLVRPAEPDDVPAILGMIRELADYEREPDAVFATEEGLRAAFFGERPAVFAHVALHRDPEGTLVPVGIAVWFLTFSTWLGEHGIWLEDLYVRPEHRGRGHGLALLKALAGVCVERGYGRLEWTVLDWNEPALNFYRSVGADPMSEWTAQRVHGAALRALAG